MLFVHWGNGGGSVGRGGGVSWVFVGWLVEFWRLLDSNIDIPFAQLCVQPCSISPHNFFFFFFSLFLFVFFFNLFIFEFVVIFLPRLLASYFLHLFVHYFSYVLAVFAKKKKRNINIFKLFFKLQFCITNTEKKKKKLYCFKALFLCQV